MKNHSINFIVILLACLVCNVCLASDSALISRVCGYQLIDSQEGNEPDLTDANFVLGRHDNDCDLNLLTIKNAGGGTTPANILTFIFSMNAADGNTATVVIYGAANIGPWQKICTLNLIQGTADANTTTWHWMDTVVNTDPNCYPKTVKIADSNSNRPVTVSFDAIGLQFIKIRKTTTNAVSKILRTYVRWW